MTCPDLATLERFAGGDSPPPEHARLEKHVASCGGCRERLDEVSRNLVALRDLRDALTDDAPVSVGPYRIERELGRGGMGVVYLAEQDHPRRRVALKLLRDGFGASERLARFERESEILGRLSHPGIAQVYEAGVETVTTASGSTGRSPYFAMELVRGVPLNEYVTGHAMGVNERLELLAGIADAVEHAHVHGVVHRDLKPDNILVEETSQASGRPAPRPKILDFGVAHVANADFRTLTMNTDAGQLVGTVPYMSPEQVSGAGGGIDARSDVYALGVLGFFLLTRQLPYALEGCSLPEAIRILRFDTPTRLGSVDARLRGDIETIVGKALEKAPERRYTSASALAADLRRHLRSQPILARPPSFAYQLRKLAARHRAPFLLAGVLFATVVGFAVWMSVLYGRAQQAEVRARTEAERSARVLGFLVDLFQAPDPEAGGAADLTAGEILTRGSERVLTELAEEPDVAVTILNTIGTVYHNLGLYDESRETFRSALAVATDSDLGALTRAELSNNLAQVVQQQGDLERAETLLLESIEIRRSELPANHPDLTSALGNLGTLRYLQTRYEEAEDVFREVVTILRRHPDQHVTLATQLNNLAQTLQARGAHADAEVLLTESLTLLRAGHGDDHPTVLRAENNVATLLYRKGDYEHAIARFEVVAAGHRRQLGPDHASLATDLNNLGLARSKSGDLEGAVRDLRAALDILERARGTGHPLTAMTRAHLARALHGLGQDGEAEPLARAALAVNAGRYDTGHSRVRESERLLGEILLALRRADEAEPHLARAHASARETLGPDHQGTQAIGEAWKRARDLASP